MSIELSKLVGDGISVKEGDINSILSANTVRIQPHIGRIRCEFQVPEKIIGVNTDAFSEKATECYSDNLGYGKLRILSKEQENQFAKLEARLRNRVHKYEIPGTNGLIPVGYYDRVKKDYEDIKSDFLLARDQVVAEWDDLTNNFREKVMEMLNSIEMQERRREFLYREICSNIPSKEAFKDSFYMNLTVTAFPSTSCSEGLSESIALDVDAHWKDEIVKTAIVAIEATIGETFSLICGGVRTFMETGKVGLPVIKSKTLNALSAAAADIRYKNIFSNPCLEELSNQLAKLDKFPDMERKEAVLEEAIISCYDYSMQNGLRLDMKNCPISEKQLNEMLALRNRQIAI